jgi:deoxyribodipyrimidine photolyase-related protein
LTVTTRTADSRAPAGTLRFVLGDQLDARIASLRDIDKATDVVLMVEAADECTYVRHHPKKIVFVLSAMRHFAQALRAQGIRVDYRHLADADNTGSLRGELVRAAGRHRPARVIVTAPGEWRVLDDMRHWQAETGVPVEIRNDDRFLVSPAGFARWAEGRKSLRMEYFYREMRRKTGLLLDGGGQPVGGTWNLDADNRRPLPDGTRPPPPARFPPDPLTREVIDLVRSRFGAHFGDIEPFWFAVTPAAAEQAFAHFLAAALPFFGDYQDAMKQGETTLYHAVISMYLNVGLLDPLAVCRRVDDRFRNGLVPLNAAEGFIRQIIGWREYVRGVYWLKMPAYAETNFFGARRPLPAFYWTGETDMNCLRQCITQTRQEAYAHHIQRLMVTGNFALLAGIDPKAVGEWYLSVYADAFEWVELPNTHGMALFADGGILGSKPYAASGKYIDRMSDYCRHCRYSVRAATGPDACPFNVLYWNFLAVNREALARNPRMAMICRTLDRMAPSRLQAIRTQAGALLDAIDASGSDASGGGSAG